MIVEFFNPLNGQSVFSSIKDVYIISKPEFKDFHERKKLERFLERTKTPEPPHSELSWPVYCAENYNGE